MAPKDPTANHGFTLVELVVTIAIIAIIAAMAIPAYSSYVRESRIAALKAVAGAINSAKAIVQGYFIATNATTSPITLPDGTQVDVYTDLPSRMGLPQSAFTGIARAVKIDSDGSLGYFNSGRFVFTPQIANCEVNYNSMGTVTIQTAGC